MDSRSVSAEHGISVSLIDERGTLSE